MSDEALREEMLRLARALSEAQRDVIRRPLDELTERVDDIAAWQEGILHRLRKLEEPAPIIPLGEWNAETVAQFNATKRKVYMCPNCHGSHLHGEAHRCESGGVTFHSHDTPAAEASEVKALAQELFRVKYASNINAVGWSEIGWDGRAQWCDLARHVLRREAALRERAENAEADLERLRDPERERLIAAVVESCDCSNDCECDAAKLARYERARAKDKP